MQGWHLERGLSVNKKTGVVVTGTAILSLVVMGCSGGGSETYSYEVSGTVEAAQVDYECEGDLALDPLSFAVAGAGSKPQTLRVRSADSDSSRSDVAASASPRRKGPARTTPSKAPVGKTPAVPKGVKLPKRPDKPERVTRVEPPAHKSKPEGCEEEHELFIRNADGLFEQDVREVDYDRCSDEVSESFPACTEG